MERIELLRRLPTTRRNIAARGAVKDPSVIAVARQFGETYFDGPRDYGYGGYAYDGRWRPVAEDIIVHYGLSARSRFLDVGCAKGFLVKDMMEECPGLEAFGIDVSHYAITHCHPDVVGRLHIGDARSLPFPDASFDVVVSINTLHNLERPGVIQALQEIARVGRGHAFVQVDSYHSEEQKRLFEEWVLTAEYHDYPAGWLRVFAEAGFSGDYDWTVVG